HCTPRHRHDTSRGRLPPGRGRIASNVDALATSEESVHRTYVIRPCRRRRHAGNLSHEWANLLQRRALVTKMRLPVHMLRRGRVQISVMSTLAHTDLQEYTGCY